MIRRLMLCGTLFGLLLGWGCDQQGEPPPEFNQSVEASGRMMVPMAVPSRKADKNILGAAAAVDESAGKKQAAPARAQEEQAPTITIDASTPEGIAKALAEMLAAASLAQLPDIVVPEQQKQVQSLVEVSGPMIQLQRKLEAVWKEKFPDDPLVPEQTGQMTLVPGGGRQIQLEVKNVNKTSDQEAEISLGAEGLPEVTFKSRKIDGAWRVELPNMPPEEELQKVLGFASKLAETLEPIIEQISQGQLASAADARKAMTEAVQNATKAISDQASTEEKPAAEEKPAEEKSEGPQAGRNPKPQTNNRQERQPDAVDGVYTGPGQLRNR